VFLAAGPWACTTPLQAPASDNGGGDAGVNQIISSDGGGDAALNQGGGGVTVTTVGTAGGTVHQDDGVTLVVPPGAVPNDVPISIAPAEKVPAGYIAFSC
jgi:hypothetical protein